MGFKAKELTAEQLERIAKYVATLDDEALLVYWRKISKHNNFKNLVAFFKPHRERIRAILVRKYGDWKE